MLRAVLAVAVLALVAACSGPPPDPLRLDHGVVTVDNQTSGDWHDIEIWVNQYFRAAAPSLPAGGRLQAPLNMFVSGYAQRFDAKRLPIRDLRATVKTADGRTITLTLPKTGLAALGGKS